MPAPGPDEKLQPSLLDRLIDMDLASAPNRPSVPRGASPTSSPRLRRDLEWLLNTKQPR